MKIIGLSGTNGSGKDTVGQFLAERYNYLFISVTEMLRDECRARGIEISRENLRTISAEWRREGGLGVLIDKVAAKFTPVADQYAGLAVASLRNPGEADSVHQLGGKVVWVDADPRVRYERIHNSHRGRDEEDQVSYEQFLADEQAEMTQSGDAATLNMAGVKALADITILNESNLSGLQEAVETALGL